MDVLNKLFESDFMPHGHCYYWEPELVWAYAVSDSVIAAAYFTIPLSIGYIVKARRDFKYYWLLILFAVFILGCGATHVMDVLNIWHPFYRFDSGIRVITAIASIGTAIMLVKITPKILLIPNADTFKKLNKDLQDQILLLQQTEEELKAAQEELSMANEELEYKVRERTKELSITNEKLSLSYKELEATDVKLKENEELFRTMADSIPNLAWMANPDGSIFWFNRRWYEYTGTTAEEMEGWGWMSVHDPNHIDKVVERWKSSILSGEPSEMIFPLKGVDGNFRLFLTRVMPIKDSRGKIKRWLGTNTDITEIKNVEERLEMQNKELLKINNDLDNFIYTASHDLKAPITNIEGLLNVIQSLTSSEIKSNEEFQQILLMIQISINNFKRTIEDLTEVSKIQRDDSEEEIINISEILDEANITLGSNIEKTKAVIKTEFRCATIKFSRKNLRSIIYNLLSNAIKFKKLNEQPIINIETSSSDQYTILTVADNGLGFPPEKKEAIFSMYKRFHNHVDGTGIGLYIVKRIIENAGGKIEVETEVGKGTIFHVFFKN